MEEFDATMKEKVKSKKIPDTKHPGNQGNHEKTKPVDNGN